ncbi:hypothetical protein MTYM_01616 [Methylococcales bacterium]|nr:hypothetical protein MTYM_01616 [Methylococcales bacterium]
MLSISHKKFDCPGCKQEVSGDYLYHKNGIPILRCPSCGLGKACSEGFDPETYYDASYFNGSRTDGYADYFAARDVLHDHFQQELNLLKKYGSEGGELLELGCAYGYFLELAQRNYNVHGIEICEDAVASCNARGLSSVRQGVISRESVEAMPMVDVLAMLDVIEHIPEPREALEAGVSRLKRGGLLLLTTGDFSSLVARTMGHHWRLMTPPQHLWFFTPRSLRQIGESLGLELIHLDHPSKQVPFGLIIYQLCRYLSLQPRLPSWMHRLGFRVNLYDAMRVVFRKRDA